MIVSGINNAFIIYANYSTLLMCDSLRGWSIIPRKIMKNKYNGGL